MDGGGDARKRFLVRVKKFASSLAL